MKKLYQIFFYVPKYGKVQDRVMTARAVVSLSVILLCLASMAITAYAWFSYNVSSSNNRITSARFGTEVAVTRRDGVETVASPRSDGSRLLELSGGQIYEVTVTLSQDSTANTGFCILSVEGGDTWHTWQLGMDGNIQRNHLTFWLQPSEDMDIIIRDSWGTSSSYGDPHATNRIGEGQTLKLPPDSVIPEQTVPTTTVSPTTVPAKTEVTHVIREGDILTAIAEQYGVTVEDLCRVNGIEDPNLIHVGETLRIPVTESRGGNI